MKKNKTKITSFQLAMITVAYVASVRAMPTLAEYGFTYLFYYILAALLFFLPSSLVSAELASAFPGRGGVYVWVKEALGGPWGFLAIWLQFISNIIGLPAFLSFVAATFAYIFMPELANNKYFLISVILIVFWGATLISFFGMRVSSWVNTFGVIFGIYVPVITILILGVFWLITGEKSQIAFSLNSFIPHFGAIHMRDLAFLAGMLYALMGMEVSGSHAVDVENSKKNYPKGIILAVLLILIVGFDAIFIAAVIPQKEISLISGVMQAYSIFFNKFHLSWLMPFLALSIVLGMTASLNASVIGPSKGLFGTAVGGEIPPILSKTNKHGMPINMLILQAILLSIISLVFLFMPTVSSSYWLIMAVVTIQYLGMYILLFISGIVLKYKRPEAKREYKVPFGNLGMWIIAGAGLISSIFGIIIGLYPPSQIDVGNLFNYEMFLLIGVFVLSGIGFILYLLRKPHWVVSEKKLDNL